MAASLDPETVKRIQRRERVLVGELPADFLRIPGRTGTSTGPMSSQEIQEQMDQQAALALHNQLNKLQQPQAVPQINVRGRLLISVMQAKLTKNYGMTRMDPYVRLHVGHNIYETPTDVNGAKNPRWNKTIQCYLPVGINHIYIEVYDECNFSVDELIAQANITIPEAVFKSETVEDWYSLSGKQGEGKEGQIHLVFSFMKIAPGSIVPQIGAVLGPGQGHATRGSRFHGSEGKGQVIKVSDKNISSEITPPSTDVPRPEFKDEDFNELKQLFPNMEDEVIRSVYEAKSYDKDSTASALLDFGE